MIKGKITAIDLIYTTCQYACPLETARLAQVQKKLGDRVGQDICKNRIRYLVILAGV
ncbi:MAG TPA: SCO family protein [Candidatus Angelobacter sp.]|nr:SCO family protein [Candidatus Angelobacter sp.]